MRMHAYMHICFLQCLRDLVLNMNSQTQAALASLNSGIQHISSEMISLREHLRKPPGFRKKVCMYNYNCGVAYKIYMWYIHISLRILH